MIRMPSDSFRGALPPLTQEQHALEQELRAHVHQLAGVIRERNLFHYKRLVAAAAYISTTLPLESLEYHDRREDFVKWAAATLGDGELAARLRKVANRRYQGEELREALNQVASTHYEELRQLR
jgi:hypothetical protein